MPNEEQVMDEKEKPVSVIGSYSRTIYSSDEFAINLYLSRDTANLPDDIKPGKNGRTFIKVSGTNIPTTESIPVKFYGSWEVNKYGQEFKALSFEYVKPETKNGLIAFLSSDVFPGIGPRTAERIVTRFGEDSLQVLRDDPDSLLEVPGITAEKLEVIKSAYAVSRSYAELAVFLGNCGIEGKTIFKINEELSPIALRNNTSARKMIEANPYILMDISGVSFSVCDKIAISLGSSLDCAQRIEAVIMDVLSSQTSVTGGMYVHINTLKAETYSRLNRAFAKPVVTAEQIAHEIDHLREIGDIVIRSKAAVYKKSFDEAEYKTSQNIVSMLKLPFSTAQDVEPVVEDYCRSSRIRPSEKQKQAIIKCLKNRVSIITGGPGTGKTTIIKGVIACYAKMNPLSSVTCMAPTGKAARRMSEATGRPATTIHKRLRLYDPENAVQQLERIEEGLVLVDEVSMVDNFLASKLMAAIDKSRCQLVLIGDRDQLPSVGPGAFLQEAIESGVIPCTRLTEIFRQKDGGSIIENAIKVNLGKENLNYTDDFQFVEAKDEDDALEKISEIFVKECKTWGIENVALLTPRRTVKGDVKCVADALNPILQKLVNPDAKAAVTFHNTEYCSGDRVMQWKNGDLSSNGDVGVITSIHKNDDGDNVVDIEWENGNTETCDRKAMETIGLAYAMSVHKSQGSEYSCVIIPVLWSQRCPLFKRNLLYTGITRAKSRVILVGDTKSIQYMVHSIDEGRHSLLSKRLEYNVTK